MHHKSAGFKHVILDNFNEFDCYTFPSQKDGSQKLASIPLRCAKSEKLLIGDQLSSSQIEFQKVQAITIEHLHIRPNRFKDNFNR